MAKLTPLEILTRARKVISKRSNWIKGYFAKTRRGEECDGSHENAVKFCAVGALSRAAGKDYVATHKARWAARVLLDRESKNIVDFNDTHTHKEVLAVFDKVIKALKAKAAKRRKK